MTSLGKDWTSVLVEKLAPSKSAGGTGPQTSPDSGPNLSQTLDQLGTQVAAGHLITTSLVSILITNDNRILVGAVTPAYLEQVAASKAAA
jgi:hypothetical protein